ncbi:MAG: FlgD immunoglobulin-like domain containing protein, partial [Lewinella sp.]|uniref:FlgD immunoglobulin-like domain containing protein n=1 Tax=Lewinella sp. TaxID=2004506 RepID=UPI003D6AC9E4
QLSLNVNPADSPIERLRINNQAIKDFMILGDEIVPVVDVTFDGQQILDGDLVSASPFIQMSITDENQYLLLADTSLFVVVVRDPLGNEKTLSLSSPEVQFFPATNPTDNVARLEWEPSFVEDGEYTLMLRGKDESGNQARLWYETHFEIITKQMLSNVLPYPNPFSTSTRFVYTLTGEEAPDQYKIQIMTISGRIVREINQQELGALQVGTHLTDFVWDGTDTYGDQLATGTYLYRVIALDDQGQQLDRYDNGTDSYFLNQIGKIVILR